tara:strand:+ start:799 stop:1485 length:687 start_codon:yes stop_codon:yes gene_type:complete
MKIVSFSLWGDDPKYTLGAVRNAEMRKDYYPDWVARFYCGQSVPEDIVNRLREIEGTEVIMMNESENKWAASFWRFLSADGEDIVISRDTDSRFTQREVDAVESWLSSDKDFHVMRDHPYHGIEIMAGMWGCRNGIIKGIRELIKDYENEDSWKCDEFPHCQVDQKFLREHIWPKVIENTCTHDDFFAKVPFPSPRKFREFVGQAFNGDNTECEPQHGDMVIPNERNI